jgi:hypothetical protein
MFYVDTNDMLNSSQTLVSSDIIAWFPPSNVSS